MISTPDLPGYEPRRKSPRWLAVLLPASLLLVLIRLFARAAARAVLALPSEVLSADPFLKTLGWTAGGWLAVRFALFHQALFFEREYAVAWLWNEAELLFVFPRWLHGLWNPWFSAYQPDRFLTVVKPGLLLLGVWTLGLHLVVAIVRAIRIGVGPDGRTPASWPRPRLRAPLPFGFIINTFAVALRLAPAFAVMTALPPRLRPYWPWAPLNNPLKLAIPIWHSLRWLILPRRLDGQVQALLRRDPIWSPTQRLGSPPRQHWSASTLELLGIEIGVISLVLAAAAAVLWLLTAWSRAADGPNNGAPWSGGSGRRSPGWAVVVLPITLPMALIARLAWRIPRWLPGLIAKTLLLYAAGVVALFLAAWIGLVRHASTNWEAMQLLRRWWDLLELHLYYPRHWHVAFHSIPHGRKERIADGDLFHAMWLLSVMGAAAFAPLMVLFRLAILLLKRVLEAAAR